MSATERRKGARAEVDVVNWLRQNGYPDARRYLAGDGRQPGDIDAIPGLCIEVKNRREHRIGEWLRQAVDEGGPLRTPVVIVKPRGVTDVGDWWAITYVGDLLELIREG